MCFANMSFVLKNVVWRIFHSVKTNRFGISTSSLRAIECGRSLMPPIRKSLYQVGLCLILSLLHVPFLQAGQNLSSDHEEKATPAAGRSIFNSSCAGCHGLDGRGSDKGANISADTKVQHLSNAQLSGIISNGVLGTGMPAFHGLNEGQVRAVVSYLRSLQGKVGGRALPGNAKRGKELFFGKGDCSSCHMISGKGGFLGPDLTDHGASASANAIRDEIVRSPRTPSLGYRTAALTTPSGDRLEGLVRNEDNFSVQLQTKDGGFHFLKRAELRNFEHLDSSLMPANYRELLDDSELNDLVSYLMATSANSKAVPSPQERGR
jgi:putative heme-binding domain-containing protein